VAFYVRHSDLQWKICNVFQKKKKVDQRCAASSMTFLLAGKLPSFMRHAKIVTLICIS
jgi:hypothetical protein